MLIVNLMKAENAVLFKLQIQAIHCVTAVATGVQLIQTQLSTK
jgi:hypothetical protein